MTDTHIAAIDLDPANRPRVSDPVNHPSHYAEGWSNGAEVIDITENLNFNLGNAVKYISRAGKKDPSKIIEDLQKAQWYLNRELTRVGYQLPPAVFHPRREWSKLDYVLAGYHRGG